MFRPNADAFRFQTPVYISAREFVVELGNKVILDVGCGNPQKLKAYILPFADDITGLDLPDVVDRIEETFGDWIGTDLNDGSLNIEKIFDLIIAADVIEHLKNPIGMIEVIRNHADENTIILISTPEKVSVRTRNEDHEKEYTKAEMVAMLEGNGLRVEWNRSYVERNSVPPYVNNMFLCRKR